MSSGEGNAVGLTVEHDEGTGAEPVTATLECRDDPAGSGFLRDRADELCADLEGRMGDLASVPDPDRMCTQIYGGPQRATVRGELFGVPVDRAFARNDGCAISDWDAFDALLTPTGQVLGPR